MNTTKIASSAIVDDPASQGFSIQEVSDLLFKKFSWRANTSAKVNYLNEPVYKPRIFPEQIVGDPLPSAPPDDFVVLTNAEITAEFGITSEEIAMFQTTINGSNAFSISHSSAFPYLYKVTNLLLRPIASDPDVSFNALTPITNKNILENTVQFSLGTGGYRGEFHRTGDSGELSHAGFDIIKETQFSFVFDNDSGVFTCYERDTSRTSIYPVSRNAPPAATVYVYRGSFGLTAIASQWRVSGQSNIYYSEGQVLIGKSSSSDPSLSLDVRGTGSIDSVLTTSLETYSDRRLKENICVLPQSSNVLSLNTYLYNYINKPGVTEIGLIAQEVEVAYPEIVREHNGFKTVQYDRIGVLLLPVVKEQQERIKTLENTVDELKGMMAKLLIDK